MVLSCFNIVGIHYESSFLRRIQNSPWFLERQNYFDKHMHVATLCSTPFFDNFQVPWGRLKVYVFQNLSSTQPSRKHINSYVFWLLSGSLDLSRISSDQPSVSHDNLGSEYFQILLTTFRLSEFAWNLHFRAKFMRRSLGASWLHLGSVLASVWIEKLRKFLSKLFWQTLPLSGQSRKRCILALFDNFRGPGVV